MTTKREVEDLIIEPLYYGDNISQEIDGSYEILTDEDYRQMSEEDIKKWYKSRRKE